MSVKNTQSKSRGKSSQRAQADPLGTSKRSRRVTSLFGKKPNSMSWRSYHAIIQTKPWEMDLMRCARYEGPPEGQPMLKFLEPSKKLTPQDRHQIKLAHDDLASGKINQSDYVLRLHRVDPAITLPLRLDHMTCKEAGIGYCVCDSDSDCYGE